MLSHELRNPLWALPSAASLRGMQNLPVQTLERARNVMHRQTKQLCRIVDEILGVSRLTSGKIVLSRAPLDFADIVRDGVEALKSGALESELDRARPCFEHAGGVGIIRIVAEHFE